MTSSLTGSTYDTSLACDRPRLTPPLVADSYERIIARLKDKSNILSCWATSPYFFPRQDLDGTQTYGDSLQHMTAVMMRLFEQKAIRRTAFKQFFLPIKRLDKEIYDTILYGIDRFLKTDYLASIYILTLQLEDLLRALLVINGGNDSEHTRHGYTKKPLGRVLRELQPTLPPSLYHYLLWILKDQDGFNLRNSIAHGFFKISNARPLFAVTLIHLLCILTAIINHEQQKRPL